MRMCKNNYSRCLLAQEACAAAAHESCTEASTGHWRSCRYNYCRQAQRAAGGMTMLLTGAPIRAAHCMRTSAFVLLSPLSAWRAGARPCRCLTATASSTCCPSSHACPGTTSMQSWPAAWRASASPPGAPGMACGHGGAAMECSTNGDPASLTGLTDVAGPCLSRPSMVSQHKQLDLDSSHR